MTAFTLGEATAMVLARVQTQRVALVDGRTSSWGRHVRGGGREAGSFEENFFGIPAKGACDAMLRAARDALDLGRRLKRVARAQNRVLTAPERAIAGLTAGAVRVFEELCALARVNQGRVYPSYDRLAAATALGRATVARALHLLEAAGFLKRQRRYRRVEGDGPGPRYAQTSNAYRLVMPASLSTGWGKGLSAGLARLLPRWRSPAPIPDDAAQHMMNEAGDLAAMRDTLSCRDLAQVTTSGALGDVLSRLGAAIDDRLQRESHYRPETPTHFSMNSNRPVVGGTADRHRDPVGEEAGDRYAGSIERHPAVAGRRPLWCDAPMAEHRHAGE